MLHGHLYSHRAGVRRDEQERDGRNEGRGRWEARLTEEQIAAAGALHPTLAQWRATDSALSRLREGMPGFRPEESLLKVAAVNALYGTNVFALVRAARHVQAVLGSADIANAGPELVESLANIPTTSQARPKRT